MFSFFRICLPRVHTCCFFFNDTATTEIYTLSLHDALPISAQPDHRPAPGHLPVPGHQLEAGRRRSEEHTSELQSQSNIVCRLLLETKKEFRHSANSESRNNNPSNSTKQPSPH